MSERTKWILALLAIIALIGLVYALSPHRCHERPGFTVDGTAADCAVNE